MPLVQWIEPSARVRVVTSWHPSAHHLSWRRARFAMLQQPYFLKLLPSLLLLRGCILDITRPR